MLRVLQNIAMLVCLLKKYSGWSKTEVYIGNRKGKMMRSDPIPAGQSLFEYSASIGLVLVVAIGALLFLGRNISLSINTMIPTPPPGGSQAAINGQLTTTSGAQPFQESSTLVSEQEMLALKTKVQTTGANGATDYLADQLETMIKAQLNTKQLTDAQANILLKLAAQGHRLAAFEKALEDASSKVSESAELADYMVQVDGESYTVDQVRNLIGYLPPLKTDNFFDTAQARQETVALMNLYQQAEQAGAFNDLQAKQTVTSLVSQIAYISELTDDVTYDSSVGTIEPSNFVQGLTEKIALTSEQVISSFNPASTLTDSKSDHICSIGLAGAQCP